MSAPVIRSHPTLRKMQRAHNVAMFVDRSIDRCARLWARWKARRSVEKAA